MASREDDIIAFAQSLGMKAGPTPPPEEEVVSYAKSLGIKPFAEISVSPQEPRMPKTVFAAPRTQAVTMPESEAAYQQRTFVGPPPPTPPPTMRAMTPEERQFAETAPIPPPLPPKKEAYGIFADPKVNWYADRIVPRLPLVMMAGTGYWAIPLIFETLQQIKNVALSLKEKSKYDPMALRQLAEMIPEKAPDWLKMVASGAEWGTDLVFAMIGAKKLQEPIFRRNLDQLFAKAGKAGWFTGTHPDVVAAYRSAIREIGPRGIEKELATLIKLETGRFPKPPPFAPTEIATGGPGATAPITAPRLPSPAVRPVEPPPTPFLPAERPGLGIVKPPVMVEAAKKKPLTPSAWQRRPIHWTEEEEALGYRRGLAAIGEKPVKVGIRGVVPPEEPARLIKKIPEELLAKEDQVIEVESRILQKTGHSEQAIGEYIDNKFWDGEKLRDVSKKVIAGELTEDQAVQDIKGDLDSMATEPVPTPTVPPTEIVPSGAKEPWQMTKEEFADSDIYKRMRSRMKRIKESAGSVHHTFITRALSEGESIPPEVLADYPDLATVAPEFALSREQEARPAPRVALPKVEEPALIPKEEVVTKYPTGYDTRGMKTFPDINVAREAIEPERQKGWNIEFGQSPNLTAWARLTDMSSTGKGQLKYVKLAKKGEFLEKPTVQLAIPEEKPTLPSRSFNEELESDFQDVADHVSKRRQAGFVAVGGPAKPSPGKVQPEPLYAPAKLTDKAVEATLKASLLPRNVKDKVVFRLRRLRDETKELFIYEPTLKEHPEFKNDMRKFQDVTVDAEAQSDKTMIATFGKLSTREYLDFERLVGLKSLEVEAKEGHSVPGDLNLDQIQKAIVEIEVNMSPKIKESLERHEKFAGMIGDELIKRGKMDAEQKKDFYFHHRVLDYMPFWANWQGVPKRFQKPFRDYLMSRKGTKRLIDFDYISAMGDFYRKNFIDNAIDDFMGQSVKKFDKFKSLSDTEKDVYFGKLKKPQPGKLYTIGGKIYKGFQYEKGNISFPAKAVSDSVWQAAIEDGITVEEYQDYEGKRGGKPFHDLYAKGGKKPVTLLPKEIAERLERFRVPAGNIPLYWKLRNFTTLWKRITLDFAGIPFQIGNFLGDAINLYKTDPAAFTKVPRSLQIVYKKLYRPKALTAEENALLQNSIDQRVSSTNFMREVGYISQSSALLQKYEALHNPLNFFVRFLQEIEKISAGREEVLRFGKLMKDLERIANGDPVVAGEADIRGLQQIDAAGKAARSFTVDYGAVPPAYARFLRGMITPFLTFYDFNARNWFKYAAKRPGNFALKFLLPTVVAMLWNNTGKRKDQEKDLGYWRYLPHITTGYYTKEGKAIVIALQTPLDMAAAWVGLDRLPANIEDVIYKKKTIEEAALQQLKDIGMGAPRQVARLLNPLIQMMAGILRKQIVPDRFKGTEYEKRFWAEFIVSEILSPYGQYLRLKNEIEYTPKLGKFGTWLAKGPIDVLRAIGYREADLDVNKMSQAYQEKEKLTNDIKNKLAIIERTYVAASLAEEPRAKEMIETLFSKVQKWETKPTGEQVLNRIIDPDTQIEITTGLIQKSSNDDVTALLKEELDLWKKIKFGLSMGKYTLKAIRPELSKKLVEIFKEEKNQGEYLRPDRTRKGLGYFGPLKRPDGDVSTELSIGVTGPEYGDKETQIPLLVPTLTRDEIDYLLSGKQATPTIIRKAEQHAQMRLSKGLSPFAQPGEQHPRKH